MARCGVVIAEREFQSRYAATFSFSHWRESISPAGDDCLILDRRIGEHRLLIEDDGLFILEFGPVITAPEMAEILREHDGKLIADQDLYNLSDLRVLTTVEPEARHALGVRRKNLPGYCVAYYYCWILWIELSPGVKTPGSTNEVLSDCALRAGCKSS